MALLAYILLASLVVSLISLIGALLLVVQTKKIKKPLPYFVSFAAGAMLGVSFLDLLPEAFEKVENVFPLVLIGIAIFYVIERFFLGYHKHHVAVVHRRHSHKGAEHKMHALEHVKSYAWMNLIGDGIHNFLDGIVIATSFFVSAPLGFVVSLAVVLHEIPQELGDFSVLLYGGLSPIYALGFNLLSAITAIAGALVGYFFSRGIEGFAGFLLPIAVGGFLYIALVDLLPELRKEVAFSRTVSQTVAFLIGILAIYAVGFFSEAYLIAV